MDRTTEPLPDVVARAAGGDVAAFETLVRRFQDFAVGFACGVLGDVHHAEDAAQEAFVEAWQKLARLREPAAFVPWFRRILVKQCDRILRKHRRPWPEVDAALAESSDPAETAERERRVRDAVGRLPEKLRLTLVLHVFLDRSVDETAAALGIRPGTVKSRLHAARAALKAPLRALVEVALNEQRPSRDDAFLERVRRFLRAAARGETEAVRAMLADEPALLDRPGPHPYWGGEPRALTLAAEWGRTGMLKELLAAGADPNADATAYDGWSPLFLAIAGRHDEAVRLLIEAGARIDVWCAAALADTDTLAHLLEAQPHLVNARGPNQATPLHFAANEDVARLLIEQGADRSALDKYGSTPLRTVAYGGPRTRGAARWLATLEEADIFIATAIADPARIEALLDADPARIHEQDPHLGPASARGGTPLHIAAALGETSIVALLLDRGADPNALSPDSDVPLHYAAKKGETAVVELLLARGARTDVRDRIQDGTPADWADFFGHPDLAARLRP